MTINTVKYGIAAVLIVALISLFGYYTAKANPSFFVRNQLAAATTTLTYMSAGAATTTLTFDTGVNAAQGADSATLLVQFTASSTSSTLNTNYEYSQDGVDWYQNNLSDNATTTPVQSLQINQTFSWLFASSTPGLGAVASTSNENNKIITVRTPTRYIRAIFTMPSGSTKGAVWAEFVAKRQSN